MAQKILIVESNEDLAGRLSKIVQEAGEYQVTIAPSMREACLLVTQQPQQLALIPAADAVNLMRALRALQPDLRLVLTTPIQATLPQKETAQFQGMISIQALERELPAILQQALASPLFATRPPAVARTADPPLRHVTKDDLVAFCRQVELAEVGQSGIRQFLFSRARELLAFCGQLGRVEAITVVEQVNHSWNSEKLTAQIQFAHVPDQFDALLLYTRPLVEGILLTLVARPETPVGTVRRWADELAQRLITLSSAAFDSRPADLSSNGGQLRMPANSGRPGYAIAWRPVRPLPTTIQTVVRRTLTAAAEERDCLLSYLTIRSELIDLVVICPPGKSSAWAAHAFKEATEQAVQRQFDTGIKLWRKGFHAVESNRPLSEVELKLFMEKEDA